MVVVAGLAPKENPGADAEGLAEAVVLAVPKEKPPAPLNAIALVEQTEIFNQK